MKRIPRGLAYDMLFGSNKCDGHATLDLIYDGLEPDSTAKTVDHLLTMNRMSTGMYDPDDNGWVEPHDVRPSNDLKENK